MKHFDKDEKTILITGIIGTICNTIGLTTAIIGLIIYTSPIFYISLIIINSISLPVNLYYAIKTYKEA